jgi:DivIVA domain-containing protein
MSLLDSLTTDPVPDPYGTMPLPQFDTAMRGYDRGQVDDYLARLGAALRDAQQQDPSPGQPYEGLGERVQGMLKLAAEEAEAIRTQARTEADAMVAEAQDRRVQEVRRAEEELAEVAARRDAVVSELCKVQDVLASLGLQQPDDADMTTSAMTEDGTAGAAPADLAAGDTAPHHLDATTAFTSSPDEGA